MVMFNDYSSVTKIVKRVGEHKQILIIFAHQISILMVVVTIQTSDVKKKWAESMKCDSAHL